MGSSFFLQEIIAFPSADVTTTNLIVAPLLQLNIITQAGSKLIIIANAGVSNNTANTSVHGQLMIDNAPISLTKSNGRAQAANEQANIGIYWVATGLAAGAHAIALGWAVSGGTGRCAPFTQTEFANLQVWEVLQ